MTDQYQQWRTVTYFANISRTDPHITKTINCHLKPKLIDAFVFCKKKIL